MKEHFSIERLWWLLRADCTAGYRSLLTVSGTLAGVIFIASLVSTPGAGAGQGFFVFWFGALLFVWGAIASSRAFAELHDKTRNVAYLLIPASSVEKTVARLLTVTLGLAAYLLILTGAVSLIVEGVFRLFLGVSVGLFNPLDPLAWQLIGAYVFVQSFYFLGAAWFRRRHFMKTTLVLMAAGIGLTVFVLLTLRVVFAPEGMTDPELLIARALESYQGLLRLFENLLTILTILAPVACWSIAWLRVRETQVSDAV